MIERYIEWGTPPTAQMIGGVAIGSRLPSHAYNNDGAIKNFS
jgi:hypothetical protein